MIPPMQRAGGARQREPSRGQRSHDRVPVDPDGASDAETVVPLSRHSRPRAAVRRDLFLGEPARLLELFAD